MPYLSHEQIAQLGLKLRGQLGVPGDAENPTPHTIIIQGATEVNQNARDAAGRPIIVYDKPVQAYSRTTAQALRRDLLAEAVHYYQKLTEGQKDPYRYRAKLRHITVFNEFVSQYLLNHPSRTYGHWDNTSLEWDGTLQVWDSTISITWTDTTGSWDGTGLSWPL